MLFLVPAAHWIRCVQADRLGVGVQGELMKPGVRVERTENTTCLGQLLQHVYKLLDHRESLRNCVCLDGVGHVLKSNLHRELGEPRAKDMKSKKKKSERKRFLGG